MRMNNYQAEAIMRELSTIKEKSEFYRKKFADIDLSKIRTQEDFETLPFTDKGDLREAYPLGLAAVPEKDIVRIHSSSGTTGTPVVIPYTKKDVEDWATMFERCYKMAGVTNLDRVQITPGYGLWTAGIGFQAGAEKLGAMTVPMGPGNTEKQLKMMQVILYIYDKSMAAINGGKPISEILKLGLFDKLVKMKYDIPNDDLGKFDEYDKEIDEAF